MNSTSDAISIDRPGRRALVTEIRVVRSDPNLRRVCVNGRVKATIRAADVEQMRLAVGQAWTAATAKRVAMFDAEAAARRDVMRLISRRAFAAAELQAKLEAKGHDAAAARVAVRDARADGWIDDNALARDIVAAATRQKAAGPRLVAQRLRRKHIDSTVADVIVKQSEDASNQRRDATDLARRRLATMRTEAAPTRARRIAAFLGRRGFDEDAVTFALENLGLASHVEE